MSHAAAKLLQNAVAHHQAGRLQDAEKAYRKLLGLEANADGLRLLGGLYLQIKQWAPAAECLEKAVRLLPRDAETTANFGIALRGLGRVDEAASRYRQALDMQADYLPALNNLGALYQESGHAAQALVIREQAARLYPDDPSVLFNFGNSLLTAGKLPEAIARYEQTLAIDPRHVAAMNNLANILRQQGNAEEAASYYRKALALRPDYAEASINLGICLRDLGRLDEAVESARDALRVCPESAEARINLGIYMQDLMRHEEAATLFTEALERKPQSVDAKWNKSLSLLALGRYAEGWDLHENGLGIPHMRGETFAPECRWHGEDITGKRLLLWCEQGLGDSLQFIRYGAFCKAKIGALGKLIVFCPPALRPLFARCSFIDALPDNVSEKDFDLHAPLMSLPHIFKTEVATIPSSVYLRPGDAARAAWAGKITDKSGFKVGLVWAGNPREKLLNAHLTDKRRSMDLETLRPLFAIEGVRFYNLQMGAKAAQIDECGLRNRITDLMPKVKNFEDTAALIEQLDLVISVDTSVVHLAGGMGKPVWVLSRFDACWRWLQNRSDSPWYPTARIFGQTAPGDWTGTVEQVARALKERVN